MSEFEKVIADINDLNEKILLTMEKLMNTDGISTQDKAKVVCSAVNLILKNDKLITF